MKILNKLKNKHYQIKCHKRYKKFRKCSIPYPFYDQKRNTFEWVNYGKKDYDIDESLFFALSRKANTGLVYHYQANIFCRNKKNEKPNYRIKVSHCHSFDEVVRYLYMHPDTFVIPKEYLSEYSTQELINLKRIQNYLHIIGLRDEKRSKELSEVSSTLDDLYNKDKKTLRDVFKIYKYNVLEKKLIKKEKLSRYENKKAIEYKNYRTMFEDNDEIVKEILKEERDYRIFRRYSRVGERYFLIDKNDNYRAILEFIEEDKIKFRDLTEDMVKYRTNGFKSFIEYKNDLYNKFLENSKWYNESFNENSNIIYAKFKLIEIIENNRTK